MARIILGVTGSAAAREAIPLAEKLTRNGYLVDVVLTEAATHFVDADQLKAATGRPVHTSLYENGAQGEGTHVALAREADMAVIAPATANTIAKIAAGFGDNLLTATIQAMGVPGDDARRLSRAADAGEPAHAGKPRLCLSRPRRRGKRQGRAGEYGRHCREDHRYAEPRAVGRVYLSVGGVLLLDQYSRTQLLLGEGAMDKLRRSRVAVFGIGGVGGYTVEALARSGVGALDLIDDDRVCLTNLNRQLFATRDTVGRHKVDAAAARIAQIDLHCEVRTYKTFYLPETESLFDFTQYDYIVDAIDTVSGKIALVLNAQAAGTPIISAMGAGNKLEASLFEVADIYETSVCPLARVMRRELRKRGVERLKVVYSKEKPTRPLEDMSISCRAHCICPPGAERKCIDRRDIPGSVAFVPSVVGLIIAGEVVKDLTRACAREEAT